LDIYSNVSKNLSTSTTASGFISLIVNAVDLAVAKIMARFEKSVFNDCSLVLRQRQ